jgi:hypothetical protein
MNEMFCVALVFDAVLMSAVIWLAQRLDVTCMRLKLAEDRNRTTFELAISIADSQLTLIDSNAKAMLALAKAKGGLQ